MFEVRASLAWNLEVIAQVADNCSPASRPHLPRRVGRDVVVAIGKMKETQANAQVRANQPLGGQLHPGFGLFSFETSPYFQHS